MGLKVWLPLNGDLRNQGCSEVTATASGATVSTSGKIGSCYSFNGSSSYIKLDQSFVTNSTTEFSYACWVKFNSTASACLFSARTATNSNGISLFVNYSGNILYDIGNERRSKAYSFSTGIWYHITFTYKKGSYKKIYVNGTEIDSIASTGTMTSAGSVAFIGASQNANTTVNANYLNGYLNDVRIWNDRCLSAAEVKEISQGLMLHYKLDDITNGIQDSSGYGHNGTQNNITLITNTARFNNASQFNGTNSYIKVTDNNILIQGMEALTINLWAKDSSWPTNGGRLFSCTETGGFNSEAGSSGYWRFPVHVYTNAEQTSTAYKYDSKEIKISDLPTDEWVMLTWIYDSTGTRTYINGTLHHTYINTSYGIHFNTNARLFLGCEANTANPYTPYYNGQMSDFRLYCTALDADAIRQLYEVGAKIDNKGNLHTFELDENSTNKLMKTGVFQDYIVEPYLKLADGSYWKLLLFHYVDNGNNLFTQANATYNNGFGLYSRLRDIDNYTYGGKYEFYVIQDDIEYRWTQTNKPTATSPSGFTAVSGYTNPVQGLVKPSSLTQTYIGYNAWWGACGSWTKYSTGGKTGIPGFGSHNASGMCTKYLALYARIEAPKAQISNGNLYAENFIEA